MGYRLRRNGDLLAVKLLLGLGNHEAQDAIVHRCLHIVLINRLWEVESACELADGPLGYPEARLRFVILRTSSHLFGSFVGAFFGCLFGCTLAILLEALLRLTFQQSCVVGDVGSLGSTTDS